MPSSLLKSYSQSLVSVSTFLSNVFFYLTSGYFATASDEKPLLHTWSLAVEEQYYIFFPVLLSALFFIGKKRLALFILALSIASLTFAQYLSFKQAVDANFYLIFSRAWELFAGSLIAIIGIKRFSIPEAGKEIMASIGFVLIVVSFVFLDRQTPFPSVYTLLPVIGTCLVIIFCRGTTAIGKFLSNRIVVGIGLISYSLYLWHQPIFAFLRMKTIGEPAQSAFILAVALTFILSIFSYKYIEAPFRNKKLVTSRGAFKFSMASIVLFFSIGLSGQIFKGYPGRFVAENSLETAQFSPKRKECHTRGENYLEPRNACRYLGGDVTWASFGDSHTVEPAYALAKLLEPYGKGILHLSFSGCPPALLFEVKEPGCTEWVNDALEYLENDSSIKNVLLGFRYSAFLHGDQLRLYPEVPDRNPMKLFKNPKPSADAKDEYWKSLREIVNRLLASGKSVYLIYPIPELPVNIHAAAMPFSIFRQRTMVDLEKTTSAEYYFRRHAFIIDKLEALPYGRNLHAIKPFQILCGQDYCPAVIHGTALYFDDDHLSVEGSKLLLAGSVLARDVKLTNTSGGLAGAAVLVPHAADTESR